jgi:hypothetical protein
MRLGVAGPGPHLFCALDLVFVFCSPSFVFASAIAWRAKKYFAIDRRFPKDAPRFHKLAGFSVPIAIQR